MAGPASTIQMSESVELTNPKIRKIAMRVVKEMELAVEKVVANQAEPGSFPLPADPKSTEQIFRSRLNRLTPEQRAVGRSKLMPRVKADKNARQKLVGDLARVDLKSAQPVEKQAELIPFTADLKMSMQELKGLADPADIIGGLSPQQAISKLALRIHRVKCVDETGKVLLFGTPGSDEISMGGTTVDESGDTKKVPEFSVGSFDTGDEKTFPAPKQFTLFGLTEGTAFPKSYYVTFVLAEKDAGGGLSDFINKLLDKVRERVIAALAAAAGGIVGASGGPIGIAIGAAIGFVVGKVFEFIKSVFADDVFPPKTVSVAINSLAHRFAGGKSDSPERTVRFVGHNGVYLVTYDWLVS